MLRVPNYSTFSPNAARPQALLRSATGLPSRVNGLPPHLAALRDKMRGSAIGKAGVLSFGDPRVDACLPADGDRRGLPLGAVHEIGSDGLQAELGAAPAAFIAALLARLPSRAPILWAAQSDDLYAPGLLAFGLDPGRLIMVRPPDDETTLAVLETALREGGLAAAVGEVGRFERIASRRLMLACQRHGVTGFILRRWPHGRKGLDQPTASATRWVVAPVPSRAEAGEPGPARWRAELAHARGGRPGAWMFEAREIENEKPLPHPFRVVAALAGDAHPADERMRA